MAVLDGWKRVSGEIVDTPPDVLEFPTKTQLLGIHLCELFGGRVHVLKIPFKLIVQLHRSDDDIELRSIYKAPIHGHKEK